MQAYIGLGSNLGDRMTSLRAATLALGDLGQVLSRSPIYETPPWETPPWAPQEVAQPEPQPDYFNGAVLLQTDLTPPRLLACLLQIESDQGRRRDPVRRNGPRTLDLDVLLLGGQGEWVLSGPLLTVPHPRLHQRVFVLRPLLDINRELVHPVLGVRLEELYQQLLQDQPALRLIGQLRLADFLVK